MEPRAYEMSMLFDFYGDLLTGRQRELFDLYFNEDLSLGEIAENTGISRQGVRDGLLRAEATLTELEEKLGAIARHQQLCLQAERVFAAAQDLQALGTQHHDTRLSRLAEELFDAAKRIKE